MSNNHINTWQLVRDHVDVPMCFRILATKYYNKAVEDVDYYSKLTDAELSECKMFYNWWKQNNAVFS